MLRLKFKLSKVNYFWRTHDVKNDSMLHEVKDAEDTKSVGEIYSCNSRRVIEVYVIVDDEEKYEYNDIKEMDSNYEGLYEVKVQMDILNSLECLKKE